MDTLSFKVLVRFTGRTSSQQRVWRVILAAKAQDIPFGNLKSMSKKELQALGCGVWDEEDGKALMLFPAEWYDQIPKDFEIESISGNKERFQKGKSNKDERFGVLPYGISVKARGWLNDRAAQREVLEALLRGYQKKGVRGLLDMAYKVEGREHPFETIRNPQKLLSEILRTIVQENRIGKVPVILSKSEALSLLSYRDDLRQLSGDRSLSPY